MTSQPPEATSSPDPTEPTGPRWSAARGRIATALGLAVVVGTVYLLTMHPGVGRGDTAGLQYMSAVLGLCHPPGYQTEILVGKLFCMLPVGPDPAWRMNLMSVLFGMMGVLALYGTVGRMTGRVVPAAVAAGTLAFSSIFWGMSLVAEVYVFYGTFLILAIYCWLRFAERGRRPWLYLMALALGFSIGGRPCELAVLPAFVPLWLAYRRKVRVRGVDLAVCGVLFVLPFCVSVGGYLVHYADPMASPVREDVLGEQIRTGPPGFASKELPPCDLPAAVRYSLGLMWADRSVRGELLVKDLWAYGRMLLGLAAWDPLGNKPLDRILNIELGAGTCVGVLGLLLAIWGTVAWRRRWGWVLLGWGMFVGNLGYYLYNHRVDSRTFVIPGLIGLSLLVGLGAAAAPWGRRFRRGRLVWPLACLVVPGVLGVANWTKVNRNTADHHKWVSLAEGLARARIPDRCGFAMSSWPGNMRRYALHVVAGRRDVTVINVQEEWITNAVYYFISRRRPVVIPQCYLSAQEARGAAADTPPELLRLGTALLIPEKVTLEWPTDQDGELPAKP